LPRRGGAHCDLRPRTTPHRALCRDILRRMKPFVPAKALPAIIALAFSVPMLALAQGQGTVTAKPAVQEAQQRLHALGYEPGPADGAMGSRTISALKKFEADHGLPVTETLDQKTLEALRVASPKAAPAPASRETSLKKGAERPIKESEEKRDWESADAQATAEAYLAFRAKYPATQRIRVLSGEVSSGMRLDHGDLVWGVCVNEEKVADGLSTDEVVGLGLADQGADAKAIHTACSMGITKVTFTPNAPGSTPRTVGVKTLPNARLIMKNVDGSWKIVAVAPAE